MTRAMYMSKLYAPTLKEDPAAAELASHRLLLRAGMIRKEAAGLYSYLPLAWRSIRKIENIVRDEMDAAGAQELMMPIMVDAELWRESGRIDAYGKELVRFDDRHGREFVLGPTHEETVTALVRNELRSYKQLPVNLYHIQDKFRDEFRPRFGLMRGREFIMKDAYSFTLDKEGLVKAYMDERGAYERIFNRLDLKYVPVHAMAGPMGGFESEEFLAPMEIGEDTFAQSPSGKAWNVEALTTPEPKAIDFSNTPAAEKRPTPNAETIDQMVEFANANHPRSDGRAWEASDILKNVVIAVMHPQDDDHDEPWRELVVVGVPGDRTVDMKRLEAQFTPAEIEEATDEDLKKHPELVKGYIGPMALGPQARDGKKAENASETGDALRYLIDAHVARGSAWFTGADEQDVDYYDLVYGRDFEADGTVEAVQVRHGDMSPDGSGPLSFERGVEIGQVFQLGLKYSNALGLKVLDQNGKTVPVWMGSYGIGVARVIACIAETHHDEKGLAWPAIIAPAQVHVVATGKDAAAFEAAERLIAELEAKGIEVIFDDRKKVSPGVKFKDAELIGVPLIAVAGRDTVNNGTIEVRDRNGENAEAVPVADAAQMIADRVAALLK